MNLKPTLLLLAIPAFAAVLTVAPHAAAQDASTPSSLPSPASAEIRVTSDRENTTLLRLAGTGTGYGSVGGYGVSMAYESYQPLCTAPCTASADPNGIFRIAGEGITPSGTFRLPGHTHADLRVHAGSASKRWWGWMSTTFGTALTVTGGTFLIVGNLIESTRYDSSGNATKYKDQTIPTLGYVGLATGIPLLVLGIVMIASSGTDVSTASGQSLARHSPKPGKLSLSPAGLVF